MAEMRKGFGVTVLAMRTKDGELVANPPDDRLIEGATA